MIAGALSQPLRILLSIHHPLDRDSGAAGVVIRIAEEYRRLGHEVRVASHDDLPSWLPRVVRDLVFPAVLARIARRYRPDVVDASSGDGWLAFRRSDRWLRVTHSHGLEHLSSERERAADRACGRRTPIVKRAWRYGARLTMVERSFRRADLSLVLNDTEGERLATAMAIPRPRIRRIRLGTDHAGRAVRVEGRDRGAVVQIGAYSARKGIGATAEAMARVMSAAPDVSMTFIGTGVARPVVVADYPAHLHDRIRVIERYANRDLPDLLAESAICLMPSAFEGYGIAKLEAMACGLAVIVSNDPGAMTDVETGVNGLVVPRGDASALAAAVRVLVDDPDRRAEMASRGVATAARFSWPAVAAERIAFYTAPTRARSGTASLACQKA